MESRLHLAESAYYITSTLLIQRPLSVLWARAVGIMPIKRDKSSILLRDILMTINDTTQQTDTQTQTGLQLRLPQHRFSSAFVGFKDPPWLSTNLREPTAQLSDKKWTNCASASLRFTSCCAKRKSRFPALWTCLPTNISGFISGSGFSAAVSAWTLARGG